MPTQPRVYGLLVSRCLHGTRQVSQAHLNFAWTLPEMMERSTSFREAVSFLYEQDPEALPRKRSSLLTTDSNFLSHIAAMRQTTEYGFCRNEAPARCTRRMYQAVTPGSAAFPRPLDLHHRQPFLGLFPLSTARPQVSRSFFIHPFPRRVAGN
jgi:hypothetical protein